jgi:endonuclease/exonuclease/phosphatase family metal-dependent hydrolase
MGIPMRSFLATGLALLLSACSHFEREGNVGSRVVPASCLAAAAPWILGAPAAFPVEDVHGPVLRSVTYNLHSGLGPQRAFWRSRAVVEGHLRGIAQSIAAAGAEPVDVVALNEVDFAARRSGGLDQARYLADALERRTGQRYHIVYGETWRRELFGFEVRFGNAVLVRHPVRASAACLYEDAGGCGVGAADDMPGLRAKGWLNRMVREPRGLIKLTVDFHDRPVDILVTHLDAFVLPEREAQAAHLLRRFVDPRRTTVVLGDMNTVPTVMTHARAFFAADRTHDILTSGGLADARVLYDSYRGRSDFRAWATYPAEAPAWPLDAILGSLDLVPLEVRVLDEQHSDHRGLYVQYRMANDAAVVARQRDRHDAIRRRQFARILQCDLVGPTHPAKIAWLKQGTLFSELGPLAGPLPPVRVGSSL